MATSDELSLYTYAKTREDVINLNSAIHDVLFAQNELLPQTWVYT